MREKFFIEIKKGLELAGNLLYPARCPVCDQVLGSGAQRMCPACKQRVHYLQQPLCCQCGKKVRDEETELCVDCKERRHLYTAGRALYEYEDIAPALYRFKYDGRREYASFFGKEMARQLGGYIRRINPDGLIPVPMYAAKCRRRGYNQAELLARALGREMGISVYSNLVIRNRDTKPQKDLNPEERLNNLKKAFNLKQNGVKLNTIILIDDIYTTGSTIDQISAVLLSAGFRQIYYVALAIGTGV